MIQLKRLIVSAEDCAGCRQCEMVCSFHHEKAFSPSLSRITVIKDDRNGLDYPVTCRNCTDCPPLNQCPTGAIFKNDKGILVTNWEICTGCDLCVQICKYNAIKLNAESKPLICDHCNGKPNCVSRCPTNALSYIDTPEFTEKPENAFNRLKEKWGFNV
jgi:Fe-S-cluster-containing hydrogenase component 2